MIHLSFVPSSAVLPLLITGMWNEVQIRSRRNRKESVEGEEEVAKTDANESPRSKDGGQDEDRVQLLSTTASSTLPSGNSYLGGATADITATIITHLSSAVLPLLITGMWNEVQIRSRRNRKESVEGEEEVAKTDANESPRSKDAALLIGGFGPLLGGSLTEGNNKGRNSSCCLS
ncbi:hypothetical protein Aperf_G00000050386 [Anoplocephala perfoliata]